MIVYQLQCDAGHGFDSWFRSGADFDRQAAKGLLQCPACGSATVEKAIMAPAVARRDLPAAPEAEVRRRLAAIRKHVETTCDDVGTAFAEEARRIHYGEADERGIFGQASSDEVKDLVEEGIGVLPLPDVPQGDA